MAVCYRSCCDISVILLKIKVNSFKVGCFGFFFLCFLSFLRTFESFELPRRTFSHIYGL